MSPASKLATSIKTARNIMRKDAGLNGDADRIPQLAWLMFLKAYDDLATTREVVDPGYRPPISPPHRWRDWASDPTTRRSGEALLAFIDGELLPYLAGLTGSGKPGDPRDTLSQIFSDTRNKMLSGYLLADLIGEVNKIEFSSTSDVLTMAHLYESMLREMRDAAGDAGEFYTPRPVIKFMVRQIEPLPGETVMDPAAGTGGFLVDAWDYVVSRANKSPEPARQRARLNGTFRGFEKKPMPFLLGQMNMLLHDLENPRITRGNALTFSAVDQRRDGVDVVLTNPPFGGEEEEGVKDYFPSDLRTSETSWLFLQSVMERISRGKNGRAAIVVPNGVLFDEGIGAKIKKKLLAEFNLHTIVRLPPGTFAPYTLIPTNVLFFESGSPTSETWFYEHPLPEGRKGYTKTKPLRFDEFAPCEEWWGGGDRVGRVETESAWRLPVEVIVEANYNLDFRNPNRRDNLVGSSPDELVKELLAGVHDFHSTLERFQEDLSVEASGEWLELAEVLEEVSDSVPVIAGERYPSAGIRNNCRGLFSNDVLDADSTKYKALHRLHVGWVVYSKLKAFEAAVSVVPPEFDGYFVSHEFPTFRIREDRADFRYIRHVLRSRSFTELLGGSSRGVGARRERLKQADFLKIRVPIPTLTKQQSLAERLDNVEKIHNEAVLQYRLTEELLESYKNTVFPRPT